MALVPGSDESEICVIGLQKPVVTDKKDAVVYDTSHGNNEIIADTVAETLKDLSLEIGVFYVRGLKKLEAGNRDFLVVGGPTRIGMMCFVMRHFLDGKIKDLGWRDKVVRCVWH